ncbi:ribosome maturation factor RimP [Bdellovibrio reynosensis]|uniref:Ribosome maturation factor RimP n=1 Tax=Bdellovibrio reynosensis TaxID=2835041 RepID=A0ABY4CCB9_9BACT|nr:ribosome maturation factor RimP [Bdellovibrio reynosensis]UOF02364.1 ribosome maturation factor RimP [Bdellovibrio reynosensis]
MSETPSWMETVKNMAQTAATEQGCLLYDVEFVGLGKGRTLRVFIDREDGNVTIDDCSNVSKALNEVLDADENLIPGEAYNLEVSTPGLERHLKQPWHFQKAVGKKIYVKTTKAFESAGVTDKKWKAGKTVEDVLESADEKGIRFVIKGVELNVPYEMIDKAKVIFEMTKGQKK